MYAAPCMSTARLLDIGIGLGVVAAFTTFAPRTVAGAGAAPIAGSGGAAFHRHMGTRQGPVAAADNREGRGDNPIGLIDYDRTGHMAVQIAPDRMRRPFSGPASGLFSGPRPTP